MLDGARARRRARPSGQRQRAPASVSSRRYEAGGVAWRHQLARILVAQLVEAEVAGSGERCARGQQLRRIQPAQALRLAQVALRVRVQPCAGLCHRHAGADRGERILQRPPGAHVHVHVPTGHQRHLVLRAQAPQVTQARRIAALAQQLDCKAQALREARRQPLRLLGAGHAPGQPQEEAVGEGCGLKIGAVQGVARLWRPRGGRG